MESNQTTRVLTLLRKFNNGEKVCIDRIIEEAKADRDDHVPNIWLNSENKPVDVKTIRRAISVIRNFPDYEIEPIRGGKGEKGCYKAITKKSFDNFITPEILSLMVQTFNLANKSDLFDNFNLDDSDKKILESKIKETNCLYEFKSKPLETKKHDVAILKALEYAIKHHKVTNIEYEEKDEIKHYEVKPYKIIFMNENFYVACEIETEKLEFSMYRISKIRIVADTAKTFRQTAEIIDFIKDIQSPFPYYQRDYKNKLIDVVVEVDSSKADFFKRKKHLKSQTDLELKENGTLLLKFRVTQEREMEELIKKWIPYIKVISPISLKTKIEDELKVYLNL